MPINLPDNFDPSELNPDNIQNNLHLNEDDIGIPSLDINNLGDLSQLSNFGGYGDSIDSLNNLGNIIDGNSINNLGKSIGQISDPSAEIRNITTQIGSINTVDQEIAEKLRQQIDSKKENLAKSLDNISPDEPALPFGDTAESLNDSGIVSPLSREEQTGIETSPSELQSKIASSNEMEALSSADNKNYLGNYIKRFGDESFPVVVINDYVFASAEIKRLSVVSDGFYPTCSLTVKLTHGIFISKHFPKDGDVISVYLRSKHDQLKPIRCDFHITKLSSSKSKDTEGSEVVLFFQGILRIPLLYSEVCKGFEGTSMDTLLNISKDLQLGFATNETDKMQDKMKWINPYMTYEDWIQHITAHSWKDDYSYFTSYIDIYYNLNFINLNKIYSVEDKVPFRDGLTRWNMSTDIASDTELNHQVLSHALTNYPSYNGSNYFIRGVEYVNESGIVNIVNGYKRFVHFYDKHTETNQDFYVDPMTTEGAEQTKIILKGRRSETFYLKQNKHAWTGVQSAGKYGNTHNYYKFAPYHNFQNIQEQRKINIRVVLWNINMNFHISQRIPVVFFITRDANRLNHAGWQEDNARTAGFTVDRFITGNYCIVGIEWNYIGGAEARVEQVLTLSRREWTQPTALPRWEENQSYGL